MESNKETLGQYPHQNHILMEEIFSLKAAVFSLTAENSHLKVQLDWLSKQIFGQKSERRFIDDQSQQFDFGDSEQAEDTAPPEKTTTVVYVRKTKNKSKESNIDGLFFDESKLPVEEIIQPCPEAAGLEPHQYEVISQKITYRLAQRPGSYVIIKYLRPVIKVNDTGVISCAPAPSGVIEGSRADVSLIAGILVDKFAYHMPLYRQHQRLVDNGVNVSRPWLTQITHSALSLLEPIYDAQLNSVRESRVVAIDETPIKAGLDGPGKLKTGYFWPVLGERDEICFIFNPDRRHGRVTEILGPEPPPLDRVLLTDGYEAYASYARNQGLTHAQCWAHTRRKFVNAEKIEPKAANHALDLIARIYEIEDQIRQEQLNGDPKRDYRKLYSAPLVNEFFNWVGNQVKKQEFLPSSPLTKAIFYAKERKESLQVFLTDPDVAVDTNHLERALRVIPMGRKAWLFCWTEVGAKYVGIAQSLIVTCRLHGIDPYEYLVDVLQRVGQHPASQVTQLIPRLWKQNFASNPLRSDLHDLTTKPV